MKAIFILITGIGLLISACSHEKKPAARLQSAGLPDTDLFEQLLNKGDSIYATKSGYDAFAKALVYFDSAYMLALANSDTLMLADAIFAKGRVYDAWNKEPQQTIRLFTEAAALFKKIPGQYEAYLYLKHLIAHAYDKIHDSLHTVEVLTELYTELSGADTAFLNYIRFVPEMALVSTEVGNYALADSLLKNLTARSRIVNDPETYNYLDHYYLTQSRLDAFYRKPAHSFYIDSLEQVYAKATNIMDKMYYSNNLAQLHAARGSYEKAYAFSRFDSQFTDSLNNSEDVNDMRNALLKSELLNEKRKTEYREALRSNRIRIIWILSSLLAVITVLTIYLFRQNKKYRQQSWMLASVNHDLDDKIIEVNLLNKEIQHRVKNNLHMIYSLLQMQERRSDNEETIEHLRAASLRVESIASLHNQLLNSTGNLDFAGYIKTLISSVVNCLTDEKKVVTHISSEKITIPVNHYFALSLILNEWVTNTIKYASANDNLIEINVVVKNEAGQVCILYADNGNPVSKPVIEGLGTQIVQLLTRQIRGELTIVDNKPFHYQLCIPHE